MRTPRAAAARIASVAGVALLALGGCKEAPPPAAPDASTSAAAATPPATLVVPPPDAGPEELQEAQRLALELVHRPGAPQIRLDLRADLAAGDLLGVRPPAKVAPLLARLGEPGAKHPLANDLEAWSWPALGVQATIHSRNGVVRLALQAVAVEGLGVFTGAVMVGPQPLNRLAPRLGLRDTVKALGGDGRILGGEPVEVGWRHGACTLYLAFERGRLSTLFVEPNDDALWAKMKPLAEARRLWDVDEPPAGPVEAAPLDASISDADLALQPAIARGAGGAARLFDQLEQQVAGPGQKLRRTARGRVVRLRIEGVELVLLELGDGWEARRFGGPPRPEVQKQVADRVRDLFAPPAPPGKPLGK